MFLSIKLLIFIHLRKEFSENINNNQIPDQVFSWNATMPLIFEIAIFLVAFLRVVA